MNVFQGKKSFHIQTRECTIQQAAFCMSFGDLLENRFGFMNKMLRS